MLIQMVLAKKNQAQIIIIEQETQVISHLVDEVLLFDGTTLHPVTRQQFFTKTLAATKQLELNRTSSTTPLLEFKNICFGYQRPLLTNVSFSLKTKQNYLLLGENGAGKSTIAQMIFRVFKPQSGTIILKEKIINHYPRSTLNQIISYVGQFPLQQITLSTIGDYQQAISHPLLLKLLIKYLNLADNFPIALLSFLQLKLLNLISSLSLTTELIILDEPTWGIDDAGKKILWQLLEELAEFLNFTLLIITHDEQLQLAFPAHILRLQNKEILNAEF